MLVVFIWLCWEVQILTLHRAFQDFVFWLGLFGSFCGFHIPYPPTFPPMTGVNGQCIGGCCFEFCSFSQRTYSSSDEEKSLLALLVLGSVVALMFVQLLHD